MRISMKDGTYLEHAGNLPKNPHKNHKYLYIDQNGNYVYPEDVKAKREAVKKQVRVGLESATRKITDMARNGLNAALAKGKQVKIDRAVNAAEARRQSAAAEIDRQAKINAAVKAAEGRKQAAAAEIERRLEIKKNNKAVFEAVKARRQAAAAEVRRQDAEADIDRQFKISRSINEAEARRKAASEKIDRKGQKNQRKLERQAKLKTIKRDLNASLKSALNKATSTKAGKAVSNALTIASNKLKTAIRKQKEKKRR